jgi:uncharacterized protein with WD repeat
MPATISKKHRPKRPDARPNGKRRKKERLAQVEKMEAKDLTSTRIPKQLHKERQVAGELKKTRKSSEDSRVRSLQKLLRQIERLGEKESAGEELDAAQLEKLGRLDCVVAELEELLADQDSSVQSDDEEDDEEVDHKE